MNIELVGMTQETSFEDGSMQNFARIRLPSGDMVLAAVSEGDAILILSSFINQTDGQPQLAPMAPPPGLARNPVKQEQIVEQPAEEYEDGALVFGGGGIRTELQDPMADLQEKLNAASNMIPGVLPPTESLSDAQVSQMRNAMTGVLPTPNWSNARSPRPQVTNENGYPVLKGSGFRDPGEILGGDVEGDEDGVGPI